MSEPSFIYSEKLVAERLGLSRTNVRELRNLHLEENVDWKKIDGAILLSSRGAFRLAKWVDHDDYDLPDLDGCLASEKKNGAPAKLIVIAICMNPRMVLANESGDANAERKLVDVGSNKKFALGDAIEAGPHDAQAGVLQLLSKLPRTDRRPAIQGSLRDPGAEWGARAMHAQVERERERVKAKR